MTYGGVTMAKACSSGKPTETPITSRIMVSIRSYERTNNLVITFASANVTRLYVLASWYDGVQRFHGSGQNRYWSRTNLVTLTHP